MKTDLCIRTGGAEYSARQHSHSTRRIYRRLIAATARRACRRGRPAGATARLPRLPRAPHRVYVVHGIPNLPVDVLVNGALTLNDFQPETVAGHLLFRKAATSRHHRGDATDDSKPLLDRERRPGRRDQR